MKVYHGALVWPKGPDRRVLFFTTISKYDALPTKEEHIMVNGKLFWVKEYSAQLSDDRERIHVEMELY